LRAGRKCVFGHGNNTAILPFWKLLKGLELSGSRARGRGEIKNKKKKKVKKKKKIGGKKYKNFSDAFIVPMEEYTRLVRGARAYDD